MLIRQNRQQKEYHLKNVRIDLRMSFLLILLIRVAHRHLLDLPYFIIVLM